MIIKITIPYMYYDFCNKSIYFNYIPAKEELIDILKKNHFNAKSNVNYKGSWLKCIESLKEIYSWCTSQDLNNKQFHFVYYKDQPSSGFAIKFEKIIIYKK